MSIASITGSAAQSAALATTAAKQQQPAGAASGTDGSTQGTDGAKKSGGGGGSSSSTSVTNEATQTNPDGSVTTITTYADGTTSTSTVQAASPQSGKGGVPTLLDPSNNGQSSALLNAQENSGSSLF